MVRATDRPEQSRSRHKNGLSSSDSAETTWMKVNHIGARQEAIVKTNGSNRSTRYLILRPVPVVQKFNRYASLKPLQAITTWRGLTRFENYQNVKTFSG